MRKERNASLEEDEETIKPLLWLIITIIILWFTSYVLLTCFIVSWSDRGTFGDSFGAINSLFSGLALAGIIYTIFLQRKELKLQRLELLETRKELSRTAEAQEKSEIALGNQAKSLKLTTQLSALNSLVNAYSEKEKYLNLKNKMAAKNASSNKEKYLNQIEKILEDMGDKI
ncbi:MAG: hypothetical protein DHS20C13_25340 [Thermodesulfobacteriota bacterium]|nr:MAG: hypothetical protein DHS20C13_25340 [Thermodesulfobacteriota bacterium]GJM36341.1 MAG: hypothetical protein DHS20C18_53420 [Saprospiraceae bacterium]